MEEGVCCRAWDESGELDLEGRNSGEDVSQPACLPNLRETYYLSVPTKKSYSAGSNYTSRQNWQKLSLFDQLTHESCQETK